MPGELRGRNCRVQAAVGAIKDRAPVENGALAKRRSEQAASWMREIFEQRLLAAFKHGRRAARHWQELEDKVRAGTMTPSAGARELTRIAGVKDVE
jgi:LAO/AO transport system kinase